MEWWLSEKGGSRQGSLGREFPAFLHRGRRRRRAEPDEPVRPGIGGDIHVGARELSVSEQYDQAIAILNNLASQPSSRFDSVTASAINQETAMNLIRERLGKLSKPVAVLEAA